MATVYFPAELRGLVGGQEQLEVSAVRARDLLRRLYADYPDLEEPISARMALVIDGVVVNQPLLEELEPDSQVHLIQRIASG